MFELTYLSLFSDKL